MLFVCLAIVLFAVGADQLTKILIFGHDMPFIKGVIRFASVENRGMVWGFMNGVKGFTAVICVFTAIVIGVFVWLVIKHRDKMTKLIMICFACIIGGAIGNLIDRAALGYVRDFICTEFMDFPVFNVADCFVTCGGILLGVLLLFTKKGHELFNSLFPEDDKKKKEKEAE
ncbi:MAG: signal peptidase II [Clostridia bacterium]|nr:signal peptidase II [Clostridia bacterium]